MRPMNQEHMKKKIEKENSYLTFFQRLFGPSLVQPEPLVDLRGSLLSSGGGGKELNVSDVRAPKILPG